MANQKVILYLVVTRHFFELIRSGAKLEEYRQQKKHWNRIFSTDFIKIKGINYHYKDVIIEFRNGYQAYSPRLQVQCTGVHLGFPKEGWFEGSVIDSQQGENTLIEAAEKTSDQDERVWILSLGARVEVQIDLSDLSIPSPTRKANPKVIDAVLIQQKVQQFSRQLPDLLDEVQNSKGFERTMNVIIYNERIYRINLLRWVLGEDIKGF